MASKKVKDTEKYWFAVGYYAGMTDKLLAPDPAFIKYIEDSIELDILKEYTNGRSHGISDKRQGINSESN